MPIYGFQCDACGHRFDRLQKLSDTDPTICPQCGQESLRRQLSAPVFRLAGSGWYETDFKSDGDKKHNLADKGNGAASADKGESKPAASDGKAAVSDAKPTPATDAGGKPVAKAESKPASPPPSVP